MRYSVGGNARHAAVVNRTFTKLAGSAVDRFAHNPCVGAHRPSTDVICGTEDGDAGCTHRVGHMHGTGIIGEHEAAIGSELDELGERSAANVVVNRDVAGFEFALDNIDTVFVGGTAKECNSRVMLSCDLCRRICEAIGVPTFRAAEGCPRADADCIFGLPGDALEMNGRLGVVAGDPTSQPKELKVIETLVTDFGSWDRLREQQAAAIAIVSSADRCARQGHECGSFEGVLQEQGFVEFTSQRSGKFQLGAPSLGVSNGGVAEGFTAVKIGNPGMAENRDVRGGVMGAESLQGGQAHNGIAEPIGRPDNNPHIIHLSMLSTEQFEALDRDGFLVLPGLVPADRLQQLRERIEELFEHEGENAGSEFKKETGARRLANCVDKGDVFEWAVRMPEVLEAKAHILGEEFKLSSLNVRSTNPMSEADQPLHVDMNAIADERGYWVANTIFMLDDFTPDNGATRVVPGSHRWGQRPQEQMADPFAAHPEQILVTGKAGTVVICNAHTWHGGTANRTGGHRRAMHAFYCRADKPQQQYQKRLLRAETQARLTPELRKLLALDDPLNDAISAEVALTSGFLK